GLQQPQHRQHLDGLPRRSAEAPRAILEVGIHPLHHPARIKQRTLDEGAIPEDVFLHHERLPLQCNALINADWHRISSIPSPVAEVPSYAVFRNSAIAPARRQSAGRHSLNANPTEPPPAEPLPHPPPIPGPCTAADTASSTRPAPPAAA